MMPKEYTAEELALIPEITFDETLSERVYPRAELKHATLVRVPVLDGVPLATYIRPEWGGVQFFQGNYYLIIGEDGAARYGSAYYQWLNMHSEITAGYWVKTAIPTAYQVDRQCRLVTLIPTIEGGVAETNYVMAPNDWVLRQPGGEIQHVKIVKFPDSYYSREEAADLGLHGMSGKQFRDWAIAQVSSLIPVRQM